MKEILVEIENDLNDKLIDDGYLTLYDVYQRLGIKIPLGHARSFKAIGFVDPKVLDIKDTMLDNYLKEYSKKHEQLEEELKVIF